jgi:hypothetical protein
MAITPSQRALNAYATATFTVAGEEIVVGGKKGTLQYLGLAVDAVSIDAATSGEDRTFTRAAHRRPRWLGDTTGVQVRETSGTAFVYPSSSGNAQPGRPFKFKALTDTANHPRGQKVTGTLSLQGPWGHFIEHMLGDRPPQSVRFWSTDGAKMDQAVLSAADLAALD